MLTPRPGIRFVLAGAVVLAAAAMAPSAATATNAIDTAFAAFWNTRTPRDAAKMVADLVGTGVTFDEEWRRFEAGRSYSSNVPKGVVKASSRAHGKEFFYAL